MAIERIDVVDDEASIIEFVRIYLEKEGFKVKGFKDGKEAYEAIMADPPDLVVLDVMLPGMDGFEVCKKLRSEENQVPIIMLTAKDEEIDKIVGLELGADDYLTKPFNPRELVARIKAVLRRVTLKRQSQEEIIHVGDITLDIKRREVKIDEDLIKLRTQEFELLRVLAEEPGRVFSRDQLLYLAWGYDFAGQTRTVDVHIAQLRRKIQTSNIQIETVTGYGYKLDA
ncbi:MAG: two-component system, OmpR family, alkaline phosphatase synthesis response regulator PhoP [Chloroflexota bacterium]|nr:two-component system, OmpR family, alkaline phosphatase synthesis response regulator PhoP [Chloroflexota bacterium]